MKYRSRTEIISEILEAANGHSVAKTKIMYHANLSHAQLKEYLMSLTENCLLGYGVNTRKFKTTEKGLRFFETYNHMMDVLKTEQQY